MRKKFILAFLILTSFIFPASLYAGDVENISYIERGVQRILTAAFQLPRYLIHKTVNGPPVVGTIDGALTGTFYTVSYVTGGIFDLARGAIPYAKYLVFFL